MQMLKGQKNYLGINPTYHLVLILKDFHVESVCRVIAKVRFDFLVIIPTMYNMLNIQ